MRKFALANQDKTRYSIPWRVACDVDFYGGDASGPVATQDGALGCSVICQQTSECRAAVFQASSDDPRSGNCYLKQTLSTPISRPGLVAVVRRNDLKPDLALMTSARFFEGPRYDAIASVFDIDTDDGEHLPHEKLFENYIQSLGTSGAISKAVAVSTSSSSVSSMATPSISSSVSTSARLTPIPILFSTAANSAVMPFVPVSSEVVVSSTASFPAVVASTPTASIEGSLQHTASTLSPEAVESSSTTSSTSVDHIAESVPVESASSTTQRAFAAVNISPLSSNTLVATSKPTSSLKLEMEEFPTDVEWKPASTASVADPTSRPSSSFKVEMENFPTHVEWKGASTTSMASTESSPTTFDFQMEGFSSDAAEKIEATKTAQPTSPLEVPFDWDLEWDPAPTAAVIEIVSSKGGISWTVIKPESTSLNMGETATATPTQVTATSLATSTQSVHSSDGTPTATGVARACAMLERIHVDRHMPLTARGLKACGGWLKVKRPVPSTQPDDDPSQLMQDLETLDRLRGYKKAISEFLDTLGVRDADEKALLLEYLESTEAEEAVEKPEVLSFARVCRDPCDVECDSDDDLSVDEKLSHCDKWKAAQTSTTVEQYQVPSHTAAPEDDAKEDLGSFETVSAPPAPETLTKYLNSTATAGPVWVTLTRSAKSTVSSPAITSTAETESSLFSETLFVGTVPAQATQTRLCADFGHKCESMVVVYSPLGPSAPSQHETISPVDHTASSTTSRASHSPSSVQVWPTQMLQVAGNIMPTVNPMTLACASAPKGDVYCNKFASVVMTVMPLSSRPVSASIFTSSGAHAASASSVLVPPGPPVHVSAPKPEPVVPQGPPANAPAKIQNMSPVATSLVPKPNQVQTTLAASASFVSPAGWVYGPPPRPDLPPPFGGTKPPPASVAPLQPNLPPLLAPNPVPHEDKSSNPRPGGSPSATLGIPSKMTSLPSKTAVADPGPLPSGNKLVPISPLPSGTGSVTSSASLVQSLTLSTASPPKSSTGSAGGQNRPGIGRPGGPRPGEGYHKSETTTTSAATGKAAASWLTLLIPLCAGLLTLS